MTTAKQSHNVIHTISLQGVELQCLLDKDMHPSVIHGAHSHQTLYSLVKALPTLEHPDHLKALAYLVNFFSHGLAYQYIDNISSFKEQYLERVEFEQNTFDYLPVRISDHGVFDTSVMHPPHIIQDELVFFVKEESTGIPTCVRCPYPIKADQQARYQLLPYAS